MRDFWKIWFFSGVRGEYVDVDFSFLGMSGYLHVRYGKE